MFWLKRIHCFQGFDSLQGTGREIEGNVKQEQAKARVLHGRIRSLENALADKDCNTADLQNALFDCQLAARCANQRFFGFKIMYVFFGCLHPSHISFDNRNEQYSE